MWRAFACCPPPLRFLRACPWFILNHRTSQAANLPRTVRYALHVSNRFRCLNSIKRRRRREKHVIACRCVRVRGRNREVSMKKVITTAISATAILLSTALSVPSAALAQGRAEDKVRYNGKLYDAGCLYALSRNGDSPSLTDEEYLARMDEYCAWTGVENPSRPRGEGMGKTFGCGSMPCVRSYPSRIEYY